MRAKLDPATAAWRHCNALTAAIAAGRHNCWCGVFGPFRFSHNGPWFCRSHVEIGDDGRFRPIPQS